MIKMLLWQKQNERSIVMTKKHKLWQKYLDIRHGEIFLSWYASLSEEISTHSTVYISKIYTDEKEKETTTKCLHEGWPKWTAAEHREFHAVFSPCCCWPRRRKNIKKEKLMLVPSVVGLGRCNLSASVVCVGWGFVVALCHKRCRMRCRATIKSGDVWCL